MDVALHQHVSKEAPSLWGLDVLCKSCHGGLLQKVVVCAQQTQDLQNQGLLLAGQLHKVLVVVGKLNVLGSPEAHFHHFVVLPDLD